MTQYEIQLVRQAHYRMAEDKQNKIQSFAFIISIFLAICFSCVFISTFAGSVNDTAGRKIDLDEKINPNNAPIASLVRLPGIGISRAKAIVNYRENFRKQYANASAFGNCEDLQKVKGIGPKTIQNISSWLKFE